MYKHDYIYRRENKMKKRLLIILAAMSLVSAGLVVCDKCKDSKDTTEA